MFFRLFWKKACQRRGIVEKNDFDMNGFNKLWKQRMALVLAGMALVWMATTAQAQSIIRRFLEHQGIEAVISPRAVRKKLFPYDKKKYRMRQKVGRFFCRIKEFRRIATRYDKLAKTFMAFVHLVCAFVAFQPA